VTHTLLVVDDNEDNRDMLSRRLSRKGFTVLAAEDGETALDILEDKKVDLVLLDVMMPGLNGLEVLKIIRSTRSSTELPVIMATAKSDSEDVVEALELGANDYIIKPLDMPVVFARVQAHLRMKSRGEPGVDPGPSSAAEVAPGLVLAGKYRIDSKIGEGAFGAVFRATHLDLDRAVAVKVLQASVSRDEEALARFRREGISACRIKHPNAVSILDFGVTTRGIAYLVMELLEGQSLLEEMQVRCPLPALRCVEVIVPVCEVLAEAHQAGIIHRDIKPSNIFLNNTARGEVVKVLDFGIAKLREGSKGTTLTLDGSLLGTPSFMAPERFREGPYDGKSDVYSLGVTLYQMLTANLPFITAGKSFMDVASQHVNMPPPPLRKFDAAIAPEMENVVMRALRKVPQERPTAAELAGLLKDTLRSRGGLETRDDAND
jgi:serine/threonine protein kinase/CheY-like chemotaxis protein